MANSFVNMQPVPEFHKASIRKKLDKFTEIYYILILNKTCRETR